VWAIFVGADTMSEFVLHIPDDDNRILQYRCGLEAGQIVILKKDLVVTDYKGRPKGVVHPKGERWRVLPGITSDPVLWLLQPDGERCTWDDEPQSVSEWFTPGGPDDKA
jgi:hypothetical protein